MSANGSGPLLRVEGIEKKFTLRGGLLGGLLGGKPTVVHAVDGVSLAIDAGQIVSLVGESGSGKTTLGEIICVLQLPTAGRVVFQGVELGKLRARALRRMRPHIQVIFQDPFDSLDPRMTVFRTVAEPLVVTKACPKPELYGRVVAILNEVGLTPPEPFLYRYPGELSGGQRQRVAIARALVVRPEFVVADEPVSMLDASVASGILNLMLDLRERHGTTILFITHDLGVARYISDRIVTLYRGRVVEMGPAAELSDHPLHPYTALLISAVPTAGSDSKRPRAVVPTLAPGAERDLKGCAYQMRCPWVQPVCRIVIPPLRELRPGRWVACHHYADVPDGSPEPPLPTATPAETAPPLPPSV